MSEFFVAIRNFWTDIGSSLQNGLLVKLCSKMYRNKIIFMLRPLKWQHYRNFCIFTYNGTFFWILPRYDLVFMIIWKTQEGVVFSLVPLITMLVSLVELPFILFDLVFLGSVCGPCRVSFLYQMTLYDKSCKISGLNKIYVQCTQGLITKRYQRLSWLVARAKVLRDSLCPGNHLERLLRLV